MSENEEIVTVNGVPLLIKGGDRDVVVKLSDLEYCITAIRLSHEHKASLHLERIVAHTPSPETHAEGDDELLKDANSWYSSAQLEEIERCAKIAESWDHPDMSDATRSTARNIADDIRDRARSLAVSSPAPQTNAIVDIPLLADLQRHVDEIGHTEVGENIRSAIEVIKHLAAPSPQTRVE